MAVTKWAYVKKFEESDACLPNTWMVVRVDGRQFSRFSKEHDFQKPNDERCLKLMTAAAKQVLKDHWPDVKLAYGQSDEYSFVFCRLCTLFGRRRSKITSLVVSAFASSFVFHWPTYFPSTKLLYPPSFDARVVLFPSNENLLDYLRWRQADCHINNLYNTCFWNLIQKQGLTSQKAEERLRNTNAAAKNEILFSELNINYNDLPQLFRRGTTLFQVASSKKEKTKQSVLELIVEDSANIIDEEFWKTNQHLIEYY